jgi:alanine racemase
MKADAYAHGADACAVALEHAGAGIFAVASSEEGFLLRKAGVKGSIIVLGYMEDFEAADTLSAGLEPAVYSYSFARTLNQAAASLGLIAKVHIKIDTGMHRLGFRPDSLERVLEIAKLPNLRIEGVFSHFATADEPDPQFARLQARRFEEALLWLKGHGVEARLVHMENSAAILSGPSGITNAVRAGISLYGSYPAEHLTGSVDLKPAMTFCARIANIAALKAGEGVGYGLSFTAERPMRIATVTAGYADGYIRAYSNKASVFVGGARAKSVGNVCMDMFMIDITGMDQVHVGDEVELFGDHITIEELAGLAGTISWEVLLHVGKRVRRLYEG